MSTVRRLAASAGERRHDSVVVMVAHWASLAGAFGVLLWVDRHQWFDGDEWDLLVNRSLLARPGTEGLLQPHNEHWVAIPILVYRALFSVFGVRTYLPYVAVTIVLSLAVAHLLFRLLLRIGVSPWLSVVLCGLFAVLGVAWQDLSSAFQWSLFGPLVPGLAALLLAPARGPLGRRDVGVVALLLVGLLISGLGAVLVVVVGLATALRRGIRAAAAVVVVPAVVYGAWYVAYGRYQHGAGRQPLGTALQAAPSFVWHAVLAALDGATGLTGVGAIALALLGIWLVRHARPTEEPWPLVVATVTGAVLFLVLTAVSRSGLGLVEAESSRYTYVTVALLLPAAAMAIDQLLGAGRLRGWAILAAGLALLVVQLSTLNGHVSELGRTLQERKHRVLGGAVLVREHAPVVSSLVVPEADLQLTYRALATLVRDGQLPGNVVATPADVLTAREYLQVSVGTHPRVAHPVPVSVAAVTGATVAPASEGGCVTVAPESDRPTLSLAPRGPAVLRLRSGYGGLVRLTLRADGISGRPAELQLAPGQTVVVSLAPVPADATLEVPATGPTTVCGLSP